MEQSRIRTGKKYKLGQNRNKHKIMIYKTNKKITLESNFSNLNNLTSVYTFTMVYRKSVQDHF